MLLIVKVHSNASKNSVIESNNEYIIHTTESPEHNKANKKVLELLSKYLKISKSQLIIVQGLKFSRKKIKIIN